MQKLFYVGIGGFIGASLRYIISLQAAKTFSFQIPMGTLIVNVIGGFFIGFIMELSLSTDLISSDMRLFLTTGILGGLTTFSTFSYETINLLSSGSYLWGFLNAFFNLVLSLVGVVVGRLLCKVLI